MQIESLNQLPVATADDLADGKFLIKCGEDHPWGCQKLEVVKLVTEYERIVVSLYAWMKTEMTQCETFGAEIRYPDVEA